MFNQIISFSLANLPLIMCILAFIIAAINPVNFNRSLFACMLFFAVGISSIWEFVVYAFFNQFIGNYNGSPSTVLSFNIGIAYLSLGITGIIAAFANWSYRAAAVITTTIFLWGIAIRSIYQIFEQNSFDFGKESLTLWTNILIPLILLILLIVTYKKKPEGLIYF